MSQRTVLSCVGLTLTGLIILAGCSPQPTVSAPPAQTGSGAKAETEEETIAKSMAKLSDADREAALKQAVCPVGGGKLGTMGAPYKVTIDGKDVFLCCDGCEGKLREDPAMYLAKLKTAP